jgi:hypothetical protein
MAKKVRPLIICILFCCGCSAHVEDRPEVFFMQNQNPYFPLALGNRWVYQAHDSRDYNHGDRLIVQITGYRRLGDRWFAVVNQGIYRNNQRRNYWTRLWSYGNSGEILMHDSLNLEMYPESREACVYANLDGAIGETWSVGRSLVQNVTLVSRRDSIFFSNRWYFDCIRLEVEELGWDHTEHYAKGVGLIRKAPFELVESEIRDPKDGSLRAKN